MELLCCSLLMVCRIGGALVLFLLMASRVGGALVLFTTDGGSCWWSSSVVHY